MIELVNCPRCVGFKSRSQILQSCALCKQKKVVPQALAIEYRLVWPTDHPVGAVAQFMRERHE